MSRTIRLALALVCLSGILLQSGALAPMQVGAGLPAPNGPGWHHIVLTRGATPEEARTARAVPAAPQTQSMVTGLPATAAEITPEIEALAKALDHAPNLIFDYVHNTIDTIPIFGTLNGATGTMLAGRGTDADQAALFIALMRASGYTATYVTGDVTYTVEKLANWVGTETAQAGNVLINGGIPIVGTPEGYRITRVWAEANIGGTTYTFDPAMKVYAYTGGLADLGSTMNYNRVALLNHAVTGATIGANAVSNINEANIRADLITYAMNLVTAIDGALPTGGVADVIGGREIVRAETTTYGATLPEALATANITRPANLAGFRHTLRIQHAGLDTTFYTFQIASKRVTVFYDAADGYRPKLRVDGVIVGTGTTTIQGSVYPMTVTVDHPYAPTQDSHDQVGTFNLRSGGAYALLHDFNTISADLIAMRQARLAQAHFGGASADSEAALGEALALLGWTWLHEVHLFSDLVSEVANVVSLSHHTVGVMGQDRGTFIDVPMGSISTVSVDGTADTWAVFRAGTMMGSAFEHGVIEQIKSGAAVSTIKLLTLNNTNGDTTFLADNASWNTVKPQLQGYSAFQLSRIEDSVITRTHTVVLPEYGDITLNGWQGTGYIDDWQNAAGTSGSLGMIISGGLHGGYDSISSTVMIGDVVSATWGPPLDIRWDAETPEDTDPVDMSTGAFHDDHLDLAMGHAEPLGLRFARTYNSGGAVRGPGPLGYGWRHDYDISLHTSSNGALGLGTRGPKDTAGLIAYAYTALDLLAGERSLTEWMTASLATKWAMDQLTNNVVTVDSGAKVLQYVRLPDGTFTPPPGVTQALKRTGNRYALQWGENAALFFDNEGKIRSWQDANGSTVTFAYDGAGQLETVATGTGITLTLSYSGGHITTVTDQAGRLVSYTYTGDDLTGFRDVENSPWTYAYDTDHRLVSVTRPEGNIVVTNAYDSWGRVITQTDALGNATHLAFSHMRSRLTDPEGRRTTYMLDDTGRMAAREDAAGNRFQYGHNSLGQLASITDRMGDTTTFSYHAPSGQLASMTGALGQTVIYTYTAQSHTFPDPISPTVNTSFTFYPLTRVTYPDGTGEHYAYNADGNLQTHTDPAGGTWHYTYNAMGQIATEINPAGGVTTYTYGSDGSLTSSTDSDTGVTTFDYDAYRRPVATTYPGGGTTLAGYDLDDRIVSTQDGNGNITTYTYDANGNLVTVTGPEGEQSHYVYDAMDRVTSITDRRGKTTTYSYDGTGRLTSITEPGGDQTGFGYDVRGWLQTLTIGGQSWETTYDAERVPTASTTPLGQTTTYQTDARGELVGLTDPLGHATSLSRDALGRLTQTVDPLSRVYGYSYEDRGLLERITLPTGAAATYAWDALGLLAQITDLNGNAWTFGNTPMGYTNAITDPLGNVWHHTYDLRGQRQQTTYPDSVMLTYTHDVAGNLTQKSYSDGTTLHYTYDPLNRLIATDGLTLTRDADGRVTNTKNAGANFSAAGANFGATGANFGATGADFGATYDDQGRLATMSYNGGALVVTYTYQPATGLLATISDDLTDATVTLSYDADRKLTGVTRSNGVNGTYTYDGTGRLTRIREGSLIDLQYTLDAAGQVTGAALTTPLDPAEYLLEGSRALTYDAASQVTSSGYAYDARGRQTAAPGHVFGWDGASRLTRLDGTTFTYNGLDNLVSESESGGTVRYAYNHALDTAPMMAELNGTTAQVLRYYVWTPGGALLYMIDAANSNQVRFYHFDRTGSTLALTDGSGTLTDAYAYAPYGEQLAHQGSSAQPFTFVGKWGVMRADDTGTLYDMRARVYDAHTTRFLSRDPAWPDLRNPVALNPYEYAMRNPVSYIDPAGSKGFLGALLQELLGLDLPPTGPWDLIFMATPTGYEGDPEWGYGWNGRFMTKEQREAWDRQQLEEQRRLQREEEERRLREWMEERHERYLRRLEVHAANQARVAARQFGGNREALLKSLREGGVWIRQGNFWLFFNKVEKWGENFNGGVWVHVEVNGEVVGIPGDQLIAEGHITDRQRERGW